MTRPIEELCCCCVAPDTSSNAVVSRDNFICDSDLISSLAKHSITTAYRHGKDEGYCNELRRVDAITLEPIVVPSTTGRYVTRDSSANSEQRRDVECRNHTALSFELNRFLNNNNNNSNHNNNNML